MRAKRPISFLAIGLGSVVVAVGIVFVGMYVSDGVIATRGEADQSPMFWYLPILFIGLAGGVLGARLLIWGKKSLQTDSEELR